MNTAATHTALESTASLSRPFYTRLAALGFGLIALMALLYLGFALLGTHSGTGELVFVSVILVIGLLVAGALLLLVVPFSIFNLQHPESAGDFIPILLLIAGSILGLVGSAVSLVQRQRHTLRARATPAEALAVKAILAALALLALVSLGLTAVSRTTLSAEAKANAVSVEIKSFDFYPNRIVAKSGETVRLVVKNSDPTLHTFTLPEAGVDMSVPPGSEKLVEFKAPAPGEYRWYCIPHSDPGPNGRTGMVGVLVVQ